MSADGQERRRATIAATASWPSSAVSSVEVVERSGPQVDAPEPDDEPAAVCRHERANGRRLLVARALGELDGERPVLGARRPRQDRREILGLA